MTIEEVAAELYAVPPGQFTALRDARARELRAAGAGKLAAAVRQLRRPTVSAWVVNALVRHRADELADLLALGERMRAATATADPDLRSLGEQRRTAVGALVAAAREVAGAAGAELSSTNDQEVAATLEAATASAEVAQAVASGRLVRPIGYAGFGDVPLPDVAALPDPAARPERSGARDTVAEAQPTAAQGAAAQRAAAQRAARTAADAADDAQRAYERRRAEARRAAAALDDAHREVAALRDRLVAAEREWARTRQVARDAEAAAREAERAARRAHTAADAARERLAQLTAPT